MNDLLFEYQVNYLSESKNHTELPFSVFSMTQQGLDHKNNSLGNQDAACIYINKALMIGAVADGCTGGWNLDGKSSNQVGAQIGSFLTVRIIRKLLLKNHLPLNELLAPFEKQLIREFKKILNALKPWKSEKEIIVHNFLSSSILFFIITDSKYLVAHCGDGSFMINDVCKDLGDSSGYYFASLMNRHVYQINYEGDTSLFFKIADIGNTSDLKSMFISTDGFLDNDIREHSRFRDFFCGCDHDGNNGFVDKKKIFRTKFIPEIMTMKNGRVWPQDDATFISVKRTLNSAPKSVNLL